MPDIAPPVHAFPTILNLAGVAIRGIVLNKTVDDGNVTFYPIEPDDLGTTVSSPQAFDNQWVPRQLLPRMMRSASGPTDAIEQERLRLVRREYIRALVNTGQVVINRAYLYNNSALYRDFLKPGSDREAFKGLMASQVVIPFLYAEPSPASEPGFGLSEVSEGWHAWSEIIRECAPSCLRLSWESDKANERQTERLLSGQLARFVKTLDGFEPVLLASDCGLQASDVLPLKLRLSQIAEWSQARYRAGEPLNRKDLYQKFVVTEDTSAVHRNYDPRKPFAGEIKQLIDLRYNANLPDALRSYLLTPEDSLRRTALQEWREGGSAGFTDAAGLTDLVRKLRFDRVTEVLGALAAFDYLTMTDIAQLRATEAWQEYHRRLRDFLQQPTLELFTDPDHGAEAVVLAYRDVIAEAGAIAGSRIEMARARRWDPAIEIMVEFAGAVVSIFFNVGDGQAVAYRVSQQIADGIATRTAKAVVHLVIGRFTRSKTHSNVDNGLRVLEQRLDHGRRDWDDFIRSLDILGFKELGELPAQKGQMGKSLDS